MNNRTQEQIVAKLKSDLFSFIVKQEEDKVLFGVLDNLADVTDLILELNSRYDIHIEHDMQFVADEDRDVFAQYNLETFQHILKDYPYESRLRSSPEELEIEETSDILDLD